jgi:hypothetical protein
MNLHSVTRRVGFARRRHSSTWERGQSKRAHKGAHVRAAGRNPDPRAKDIVGPAHVGSEIFDSRRGPLPLHTMGIYLMNPRITRKTHYLL